MGHIGALGGTSRASRCATVPLVASSTTPASSPLPTPAFFLAGGTGISAETLGNMMLQQFPSVSFTRRKIPFITTVEQARVVRPDGAADIEAIFAS